MLQSGGLCEEDSTAGAILGRPGQCSSVEREVPTAGIGISWKPGDTKWVCLGWKGCAMASLRPIQRTSIEDVALKWTEDTSSCMRARHVRMTPCWTEQAKRGKAGTCQEHLLSQQSYRSRVYADVVVQWQGSEGVCQAGTELPACPSVSKGLSCLHQGIGADIN